MRPVHRLAFFLFCGEVRAVLRVPGLRDLPSRLAALGVRRVRLERPEEVAPAR
jgi:hypothetical protein